MKFNDAGHDASQFCMQSNSDSTTDSRPTTDHPWYRKLLLGLIPVLVLLVIAEATFWVLDSRWHFRYELLKALAQVEVSVEPIAAQSEDQLMDPAEVIIVRAEQDPEPTSDDVYIVGGRAIPDARVRQGVYHVNRNEIAPPTRRRIVIVGGSAALGFPYGYGDTFAGHLQSLAGRDDFFVINCARRGWVSGTVTAVAERAIKFFSPDTLVVMAGNNDWAHWQVDHPYLSQSMEGLDTRRALANSRLLAYAQYTALKRAVDQQHHKVTAGSAYTTDYELEGYGHALRFPLEDFTTFDANQWRKSKERFLNVFEDNLMRIVEMAEQQNVRVLLLTLPFNYKLSPAWKHPQPESFATDSAEQVREAIHSAAAMCDAGEYAQALETIDAALALDPYPPVANYIRGYCLEQLGQFPESEQAYTVCREQMIGNLGSRLSVNERIREVAETTGATLIDVCQIFDEHNHETGRYFNVDLIHDDCHPTPQGHQLIAKALAAELGIVAAEEVSP